MNARAPEQPNGDTIADRIQHHQQSTNFSDIARDLTDAHAHRPGVFAADLERANAAFHAQGLLPHMDIVGVQGNDLVVHDDHGHTLAVDSTHLSRHHVLRDEGNTEINGRTATINADGSGSVKVNHGDSAWSVAHDVLASQGVDNPSNNQIANYIKELQRANGDLSTIHPGDSLQLPATTRAGDGAAPAARATEAQTTYDTPAERAADPEYVASRADVQHTFDLASHAAEHFAGTGTSFWNRTIPASVNMDDITHALQGHISDDDRQGLEFLRDNYDSLKHTSSWDGIIGIQPNIISRATWKNGEIMRWQELTTKIQLKLRDWPLLAE